MVEIFANETQLPSNNNVNVTLPSDLNSLQIDASNLSNFVTKFRGLHINECVSVECCAGSAILSFYLQEQGLQAIPVDHKRNEHSQRIRCLALDLTDEENQKLLLSIICDPRCVYLHMAPPCGTCSRARERPIPLKLQIRGAPRPRPLRDANHLRPSSPD